MYYVISQGSKDYLESMLARWSTSEDDSALFRVVKRGLFDPLVLLNGMTQVEEEFTPVENPFPMRPLPVETQESLSEVATDFALRNNLESSPIVDPRSGMQRQTSELVILQPGEEDVTSLFPDAKLGFDEESWSIATSEISNQTWVGLS
jgi:hypothetical protein